MTTVEQLQRAAAATEAEHAQIAREITHQQAEAQQLRSRIEAATLESDSAQLAADQARLQLLDRSIVALRPKVEQARQQAQRAQEQAAQAAHALQSARQRLTRLEACEDGDVVLLRIADWRELVKGTRQQIAELSGQAPPEVAMVPPLAEVELV